MDNTNELSIKIAKDLQLNPYNVYVYTANNGDKYALVCRNGKSSNAPVRKKDLIRIKQIAAASRVSEIEAAYTHFYNKEDVRDAMTNYIMKKGMPEKVETILAYVNKVLQSNKVQDNFDGLLKESAQISGYKVEDGKIDDDAVLRADLMIQNFGKGYKRCVIDNLERETKGVGLGVNFIQFVQNLCSHDMIGSMIAAARAFGDDDQREIERFYEKCGFTRSKGDESCIEGMETETDPIFIKTVNFEREMGIY